jgi:hypothetical protein
MSIKSCLSPEFNISAHYISLQVRCNQSDCTIMWLWHFDISTFGKPFSALINFDVSHIKHQFVHMALS